MILKVSSKKTYALIILISIAHLGISQSNSMNFDQEELDKLILSALKESPQLRLFQSEMEINDVNDHMNKLENLGLFTVAGNLNEFSLQQSIGGTSPVGNFFPRYNIGVQMRLNHFHLQKQRKRLIEQNYKMIAANSELAEDQIRSEVRLRYVEYLKEKNSFNIVSRLEQFSELEFNAIEQKFADGEASLDDYNKSRANYYASQMRLIESESKFFQAKISLETIANAKLEELGIE